MNTEFQRAKVPLAALYFIFARKRFLQLAVRHGMAINLEAPDLRAHYEKGDYPKKGWEIAKLQDAAADAKRIQKSLVSSFLLIAHGAVFAVAIGFLGGSLEIERSLNAVNVLAFAGTFLVAWATLMELGGALQTWSGESLPEQIHPFLFKVIFVPGVTLLFISLVL